MNPIILNYCDHKPPLHLSALITITSIWNWLCEDLPLDRVWPPRFVSIGRGLLLGCWPPTRVEQHMQSRDICLDRNWLCEDRPLDRDWPKTTVHAQTLFEEWQKNKRPCTNACLKNVPPQPRLPDTAPPQHPVHQPKRQPPLEPALQPKLYPQTATKVATPTVPQIVAQMACRAAAWTFDPSCNQTHNRTTTRPAAWGATGTAARPAVQPTLQPKCNPDCTPNGPPGCNLGSEPVCNSDWEARGRVELWVALGSSGGKLWEAMGGSGRLWGAFGKLWNLSERLCRSRCRSRPCCQPRCWHRSRPHRPLQSHRNS